MKLYFESTKKLNKKRMNESANSNYLNSIISNLKQLANSEEYSELLSEAKRLVEIAKKLTMNSYKIWNIDILFKNNELTKDIDEEDFLKKLFSGSDIRFYNYSWTNGLSVTSDLYDDEAELKIKGLLDAVSDILSYEM